MCGLRTLISYAQPDLLQSGPRSISAGRYLLDARSLTLHEWCSDPNRENQNASKSTIITATKIDDAAKTTVPKNCELDFCWATGVGSVSVCVLMANQ
jgi:hypothetical protein